MIDKLSNNLYRHEFACKCGCGMNQADIELVNGLQEIRDYYERPLVITSGNRCYAHNLKSKGSEKSFHLRGGQAVDFYISGISPQKIYDHLHHKYYNKYGLGNGARLGFTHLDIRPNMARWEY